MFFQGPEEFCWDFDGDCIESIDCFGRIAVFYYVDPSYPRAWGSFYFLVSSSISFFKDLKFLWNRSFSSLVSVAPRYFTLFIVKGDISLISLSISLSFVYRRSTDVFELILYPATSLKVFIRGRTSLVEFCGHLYTPSYLQVTKIWLLPFQFKSPLSPYVVLLLLLKLQELCWRDMERADSLVSFLILVESLWVSLHLIWC